MGGETPEGRQQALAHQTETVRTARQRLRELLEQDEATYGVAFTNVGGERVHPEQVFKSEAGTYTDYLGRRVRLWQSSSEV